MSDRIVRTRAALQAALGEQNPRPGLVPTLGALHAGHQALIRQAAAANERVVVSVFLNPTQFTNPEDLSRYPRNLERDVALAVEVGADLIYAPAVAEMYPAGDATTVHVAGLTDRWEGAARPGHFAGVATVVTKVLNHVRPARAYFGEKDFQQLVVIRRLHADLVLPGEIVACRTVRDADGLALSSRNAHLSPTERRQAATLWRALFRMRTAVDEGVTDVDALLAAGEKVLLAEPAVRLDYLAVVDPVTLDPLELLRPGARAFIAATVGGTRLIDNVELGDGSKQRSD